MFCTECGKENKDANKFCTGCGKPLKKPNGLGNVKEPESKTWDPVPSSVDSASSASPPGSDGGTTILGDDTKLTLIRQDGQEFRLSEFPACVGKGSAADCIVDGDESVSRQHICIHENGKRGFVIEDMNSTNRTYLNNDVLQPEELVNIKNNDKIKMGKSVFTVSITD